MESMWLQSGQIMPPPLNSSELQDICDTIVSNQDHWTREETITAATLTSLGLATNKLPNDAFLKLDTMIKSLQSQLSYNCRIWNTTYMGNGQESMRVAGIPFTPKAVIISQRTNFRGAQDSNFIAIGGATSNSNVIVSMGTAFTMALDGVSMSTGYIMNGSGTQYNFVAIG